MKCVVEIGIVLSLEISYDLTLTISALELLR